jgi:putative transposase
VTRSGYYNHLKKKMSEEEIIDREVIKATFDKKKGLWGYRNVCLNLPKDRYMNHKKVRRIMKVLELKSKIRSTKPYRKMAKATQEHRTAPNLLNRGYSNILTPYHIFGTDISYFFFNGNLAYLSIIRDMSTGEVVGKNMSTSLSHDLVLKTIDDMVSNIPHTESIMIHSDQGWHYTHPEYIRRIEELGMLQSMSRRGNCHDNAPTESFFGHLKDEVDYKNCDNFAELKEKIMNHIIYHNTERRQWNKKKMTPVEYRNHLSEMTA